MNFKSQIENCKKLSLKNLRDNAKLQMVFHQFRQLQKKSEKIYTSQNRIIIEMKDPEIALQFYNKQNFKAQILYRPIHLSFQIQNPKNQKPKDQKFPTRFQLDGLRTDKQRKVFEAASKIGYCDLKTSYHQQIINNQIKPHGQLIFYIDERIPQQKMHQLQQDLKNQGITIKQHAYVNNWIKLQNFIEPQAQLSDIQIQKIAILQATKIIQKISKIKFKDIVIKTNRKENKEIRVLALIQYDVSEVIYVFELIRKSLLLQKGPIKAVLCYNKAIEQSYQRLFSSGLKTCQTQSEKEYENTLLQAFKKVNQNIIQVSFYCNNPQKNGVIAIDMLSQKDGRDFLVSYTKYRKQFYNFYIDGNKASFTLNVNKSTQKTLRKMKHFKKKLDQSNKKNDQFNKKGPSNRIEIPDNQINTIIHENPGYSGNRTINSIGETLAMGNIVSMGNMGVMGTMGTMGTMGAMGAMGTMGSMGAMGAMGAMGSMGAMGAMGSMGAMGAMGAMGSMGNTGAMVTMGNKSQEQLNNTISSLLKDKAKLKSTESVSNLINILSPTANFIVKRAEKCAQEKASDITKLLLINKNKDQLFDLYENKKYLHEQIAQVKKNLK